MVAVFVQKLKSLLPQSHSRYNLSGVRLNIQRTLLAPWHVSVEVVERVAASQ